MASSNWLRNKIDKAIENRKIRRATETGTELSNAGVTETTQTTTTGSYVTPSGTVDVTPSGKVTIIPKPNQNGGGSSSNIQGQPTPTPTMNPALNLLQTGTKGTASGLANTPAGAKPNYFAQQKAVTNIKTQYQNAINSGQMTYEEANARYQERVKAYQEANNPPVKEGERSVTPREYLTYQSTSYQPEPSKFETGVKKVEEVGSNFIGIGLPSVNYGMPVIKANEIPTLVGKGVMITSLSTDVLLGKTPDINKATARKKSAVFTANMVIPQTPSQVLLTGLSFALPVARANYLATKIPKTEFFSFVTRKDGYSSINSIIQTGKGKTLVKGLTRDIVLTGDKKYAGGGAGFIKYTKNGKVFIEKIKFAGLGNELGSSKLVFVEGSGIKASRELGEGVLSQSFIKSTGQGLKKSIYYNPFTKTIDTTFKNIKISSISGMSRAKMLGSISPIGDGNMFFFQGSRNPLLRVYKKGGLSYVIRDTSVKGGIVIEQESGANFIKSGFNQVQTTKTLTTSEILSIQRQVSAVPTISQSISPSVSLSTGGGIATFTQSITTLTPTRQTPVSKNVLTTSPISSSVLNERVITTPSLSMVSIGSSSSSTRQLSKQISFPASVEVSKSRLNLNQESVQQQKLSQKMNLVQPQILQLRPMLKPSLFLPRPFITGKPIPRVPKLRLSKRESFGGGFGVSVRRGGKFYNIGSGLSLGQAYSRGLNVTQKGLGQTFKITGKGFMGKAPKGYYSKVSKKDGLLFIEKAKSKINTPSEKFLLKTSLRKKKKKGVFEM